MTKKMIYAVLFAIPLICILVFAHPIYRLAKRIINKIHTSIRQESIIYWKNEDAGKYETNLSIPNSDNYLIAVYKNNHVLKLIKQNKIIKDYKVNVRNDLPDRLLENDGQTPEGIFKIWQMAIVTEPAWTRWMALDTTDKAKNIFVKEFAGGKDILEAYEKKYGEIKNDAEIRMFNSSNPGTPMLRGFGIHGGGFNQNSDWTIGCPALDDQDVVELYDIILTNPDNGIGTMVIIMD